MPDFIKENYPLFIAFTEAYYEWLEETGNLFTGISDLLSYRDIDETLEQFLSHFQNEFLLNIPNYVLANKRLLVKYIKDFYRARGSEKSYKLLFRILYDEDVEFYYPKKDLLKPSDGKWSSEKVLRVSTIHNTFDYVSHEIVGEMSGAYAHIENVIQFNFGSVLVSELYLSEVTGEFQIGENINVYLPNNNILQETIYGIVIGINIENPGTGYKANDVLIVNTNDSGSGAIVSVESVGDYNNGRVQNAVNSVIINPGPPEILSSPSITISSQTATAISEINLDLGTVTKIRIINPGRNYESVPNVTLTGNATAIAILNSLGKISNIAVDDPGSGYTVEPTVIIDPPKPSNYYIGMNITIIDGPGSGQIRSILSYNPITEIIEVDRDWLELPNNSSHYSISLGKIKKVLIKDFGLNYEVAPNIDSSKIGNGDAVCIAEVGALGVYPGRWLNTDSFLSSDKKLQDSYYWQDFSYVLKVGNSINIYRDIVKKLLHPVGTILFGQVQVQNKFMIGPTFKTLERNKFYFAPYEHFAKEYRVNAGELDEFVTPLKSYPAPNASYYGDRRGYTNTPNDMYSDRVVGDVILKPNSKRNHVADSYVKIFNIPNKIPLIDIVTEYDCIEGIDPEILYDIHIPPVGYNQIGTFNLVNLAGLDGYVCPPMVPGHTVTGSINGATGIVIDEIISPPNYDPDIPYTSVLRLTNIVGIFRNNETLIDEMMSPPRSGDILTEGTDKNGILGRNLLIESCDPTFSSVGLSFNGINQMVSCNSVPINPLKQSVIIVAKVTNLLQDCSLVGSIDSNKNSSTTGYEIKVDTSGKLIFRSQKNNGLRNDLFIEFPSGTINPNIWFCAGLRYENNILSADFNNLSYIKGSYTTDVDGTPIINNSTGWTIGNQGFISPITNNTYFNKSIFGKSIWGFLYTSSQIAENFLNRFGENDWGVGFWGGRNTNIITINPIEGVGNFLNGMVAYVIIYNRALTNFEYTQTYKFLRTLLSDRGIVLP